MPRSTGVRGGKQGKKRETNATSRSSKSRTPTHVVQRVQTGVRMEKRLLKVLKALAEDLDMTLGDMLESVVLHAFEGKCAFERRTIARIKVLKEFYGLDLDARSGHHMIEADPRA